MKTLVESILSSTKSGKSGIYEIGKYMNVDGIPCTVIYNDGKEIVLLSDTFCGTQSGKPFFRSNDEITRSNFAFYEFERSDAHSQRKYLPKGWQIPSTELFDRNNKQIQNTLIKYILPGANYNVSKKFWTRSKNGSSIRYFACNVSCPGGEPITYSMYYEKIGVRFAKTIKL